MSLSVPAPALSLSIPPYIYCAGSYVEGEVLLEYRQLQDENIEEVHVELRGASHTIIEHNMTIIQTVRRETHSLVHADMSLWAKDTQYPPPGSNVLRVPFRFLLPPDLPPSFHYNGWQKSASVLYSLAAVGVRPGTSQTNKRLRIPLVVLQNDGLGASLRPVEGLSSGWRRVHGEQLMREGLWGEYATAWVQLSLPDIPVLPLFTDIPYIIKIVTTTAPLTRSKADTHPLNKPIFPAPPASPSELDFRLYQTVTMTAESVSASSRTTNVTWILGDCAAPKAEIELSEKEWVVVQSGDEEWVVVQSGDERERVVVPNGDEKGHSALGETGRWVQRATIQSKLQLNVTPTFATGIISCKYHLRLKVPFAGLGNDVILQVPVHVNSGIDAPMSRQSPPVQNGVSQQQGQTLDLPPAYWDTSDHHWRNMDEIE